jgi:hypothetical protein
MKTYSFGLTLFILFFSLLPAAAQTNQQLEQSLKEERERKKILSAHLRKNARIQKYIYRRGGRNIRDVVFDFDKKVFDNEPPLTEDTIANPPFEIHEMDGLRIKIKNLNPFIYSVDLFELQGDQISNEKLRENSQTAALKVDVPLFKELELTALTLVRKHSEDSADYKTQLKNKAVSTELYFEIANLEQAKIDIDDKIAEQNFMIANKFDHSSNDTLSPTEIPKRTFEVKRMTSAVTRIESTIAQLRKHIKDNGLDTLTVDARIRSASNKLTKNIRIKAANDLKSTFAQHLRLLKDSLYRINQYIFLHNQLVGVTRLATNNYDSLRSCVDGLFSALKIHNPNRFGFSYLRVQQFVLSKSDEIKSILKELMNMSDSLTREQIRTMEIDLNTFVSSFKSFDHVKLVNQVIGINGLINRRNFELTYETLSIVENADFIKYRLEFKPNASSELPLAKGPFNLELSFLVNEGLKVDVSTGVMLDFNLADPKYYFDKFSTTTSGGQVDSVRVKKSSDTGHITPSVNLMLNAYKRSSLNFKPGISLGFGVSNDIRFRLYAGPSLIIGRKERITIMGGAAFGAVLRNADGYNENKTFEDNQSLPTEVPMVQDKFKFGWFFGAGFNFSGKDTKGFVERIKFK